METHCLFGKSAFSGVCSKKVRRRVFPDFLGSGWVSRVSRKSAACSARACFPFFCSKEVWRRVYPDSLETGMGSCETLRAPRDRPKPLRPPDSLENIRILPNHSNPSGPFETLRTHPGPSRSWGSPKSVETLRILRNHPNPPRSSETVEFSETQEILRILRNPSKPGLVNQLAS